MTEQEKFNAEVQTKLAIQDAKFAIFMNELKEQREDIRRLQERQDVMHDKLNAKIDSKFDTLTNQIHNLTIAAVVGFSAIVVAVGGMLFTALK